MQNEISFKFITKICKDCRFVPAVPALDVTFILKIRSDLNIDASDFLSILRKHVRARGFDGNTIDDKSISLKRF